MKSKKLRLIGVASFVVVLIAVGVMVWPTPKEAKALEYALEFEVQWLEDRPMYNVTPTFELLHDGIPFVPPVVVQLQDVGDHCTYVGFVNNPSSTTTDVRLQWNTGNPNVYRWENWAPGEEAPFNFSGTTWAETHAFEP